MRYKDILTENFLYEQYVVLNKTKATIARDIGVTVTTFNNYCNKYKISSRHGQTENLKDREFEDLIVEEQGENDAHHKVRWWCRCKCGNRKLINAASLIRGLTTSCGCKLVLKGRRGGYKDISYSFWRRAMKQSAERGILFSITMEYIWGLYEKQGSKCAMTDLFISFCPNYNHRYKQTASLDRIDSAQGYVEGNVQIVHKVINQMKSFLGSEEFISFCNLVANKHRRSDEACQKETTRTLLSKI